MNPFKSCYKKVNGKKFTREEYFAAFPQVSNFEVRNQSEKTSASRKPVGSVSSISDWLAWRMKGIGGSDAPAVMGASPWCDPQKLWELKTGRRAPDPQTFPMRRGRNLEPVARELYEQMSGIEMPADTATHSQYDFLRASLDGINKNSGIVLEIKCPGKKDHAVALQGNIPEKYIWQLVHILMVTDLDTIDYFSYHPDAPKKGVIISFDRDRHLERMLLPKEMQFWENVVKDVSPSTKKEVPMDKPNDQRKPANGVAFTQREVVEILQEAKRLGVTGLILPGFEATFDVQGTQNKAAASAAASPRQPNDPCEDCGEEKILGTYGTYCRSCYIEKKENNKWNQKKRW